MQAMNRCPEPSSFSHQPDRNCCTTTQPIDYDYSTVEDLEAACTRRGGRFFPYRYCTRGTGTSSTRDSLCPNADLGRIDQAF